jgi:hypothetical protein
LGDFVISVQRPAQGRQQEPHVLLGEHVQYPLVLTMLRPRCALLPGLAAQAQALYKEKLAHGCQTPKRASKTGAAGDSSKKRARKAARHAKSAQDQGKQRKHGKDSKQKKKQRTGDDDGRGEGMGALRPRTARCMSHTH